MFLVGRYRRQLRSFDGLVYKDCFASDFRKYAHYITAIAKDQIRPEELDSRFIRYSHAQRYSLKLFDPAYDWMKQRGFTDGRNTHGSLVLS